jgi:hypothetical protein
MANVIGPSLGSRPGSRRLCILSGRPLRVREFVETLEIELNPHDEIEIIRDRRRSSGRPPAVDRRRQGPVDSWLSKHNFAIVPVAPSNARPGRRLAPPLAGTPAEYVTAPNANSDQSRFQRSRRVAGRWKVRLGLRLIVGALVGVAIGVTVANFLLPTVQIVMSRVQATATPVTQRTSEPPPIVTSVTQALPPIPASSVNEASPPTIPAPTVSEPPRPTLPDRPVLPPVGRSERFEAERPRDARASLRGGPRPDVVSPLPEGRTFGSISSQSGGLPTMQVQRRPAPASEGGGEIYALRLSDTAGQSLAGAEVSLFIRMADGAFLDLPVGEGPEPGTYQVTVPPLQSAPVDLRIRVATSDTRAEIPLAR